MAEWRRELALEVPDEIEGGGPPPSLPEWASIYTEAWDALRADRSLGQGVIGRIYYASMAGYARDIGLAGEAFHRFIRFVTALDDEYVAAAYERMKKAQENGQK